MARIIEAQILTESEADLTIRLARRNGKYLDQLVNKVPELTTEQLVERIRRRTVLKYLQNRILPSKWTAPEATPV